MLNEMRYFCDRVWEVVSEEEMRADSKATATGGRWVVHNKGDNESPNVRARYVATEVNREANMDFYAATPPLEAKKLLFATRP